MRQGKNYSAGSPPTFWRVSEGVVMLLLVAEHRWLETISRSKEAELRGVERWQP